MKKENGFTLIELLAVIVILAIIAVIATPLTINVINDSKEKSFINSVYGLIDGVRLLSAEQLFEEQALDVVVNFTEGVADNTNFKISGEIPNSGTIHLNSEGKVELKVWSSDLGKCAEKGTDESEVKLTDTSEEDCKIEVETCSTVSVMGKDIFTCDIKNDDPNGNLRYVGSNPDNYVYFNKDAEGDPELWRIIGVFDGKVKIISNNYYNTSIRWDDNSDGSYLNDWNIGGTENYNTSTRSDFYNVERGSMPAGTEGASATWNGAIGLMYPSDYGYSTSGDKSICDSVVMWSWTSEKDETAYEKCVRNSWLYDSNYRQLTLTPHSGNSGSVYIIYNNGSVSNAFLTISSAVRPTLYLKESVKIVDGTGTDQDPYVLSMVE